MEDMEVTRALYNPHSPSIMIPLIIYHYSNKNISPYE
jgi:hypothetical protein